MTFDPHWEEIHKAKTWGRYPSEHVIRYVFRNFPHRNDLKALDLGCGNGAQSMFLSREGFYVEAIDGSQSAIDRITKRKFMDDTLDNLHPKVGDVCELPYESNVFDLVVDCCTLQHINIPEAVNAISEAVRVLKSGGKMISITARWDDSSEADTPMRRMRLYEVNELYKPLRQPVVEKSSYTDNGVSISHWIVTGRKEILAGK